jgi:precorrin-6Y C5,15-methyltransferase (decarboxylating)
MTHPVTVLGLGAEGLSGLSARARQLLDAATWIAGGMRHLELAGPRTVETFAIRDNLDELTERLQHRKPDERCVVLASGDPLFYGIGHRLGQVLGTDQLVVEPAVSSRQLAFARAGVAWHDAAIASIHGRVLAKTLIPLLGQPKIGLFTHNGSSPSAIASFFQDRGLENYWAWVGERLGTVEERVTCMRLAALVGQTFDALNFLVLLRGYEAPPVAAADGWRLTDSEFAQPDSGPILLTHTDVRAAALARFRGLPDGPIWDIGAGLGGMAVTLARAFPDREVVAIERAPARAGYLKINRTRFGVYNLRIIESEAPEGLAGEGNAAGVFLGGSAGRLGPILDLVFERLEPGGVLVANFVGIENLSRTLDRLRQVEWRAEVALIQISQGKELAGVTALAPQRPVWVVRAVKP